MINRIVLVGRMVADPEERTSNDGMAIAKFKVAVDRRRKNRDGEKEADFFNVVCFRQSAEFVLRYLGKGDLVGVDGSLQIDNYERDGVWKTWVEVTADNVQSLGSRGDGGGGGGGGRSRSSSERDSGGGGSRGGGGRGWDHDNDFSDEPLDGPEGGASRRPSRDEGEGPRGGGGGRGESREPAQRESRSQQFEKPAAAGGNFQDDEDDPFAEE